MSGIEEMIEQIKESLTRDDYQMFKILIDNEPESELNKIRETLHDIVHKQKWKEFKERFESEQQVEEHRDNIRKINADKQAAQSGSEQSGSNIIEQQVRRRVKKIDLQQKLGYSFYGNVKCLMVSYGGNLNPKEECIKMMHSQLSILVSKIFKPMLEEKKSGSEVKKYLQTIFLEQVSVFTKLKNVCKKIKKCSKRKTGSEDEASDDFPSDDDDSGHVDHMHHKTQEQKEYFLSLTRQMNEQQYDTYSQCRIVNFLPNKNSKQSRQKLAAFVDRKESLNSLNIDMQLLSFLFCRLIRKIIFKILRERNGGKLIKGNKPLQVGEVISVGNQMIEEYSEEIHNYVVKQNPDIEAKQTFIKEFITEKYDQIIPKTVIKGRNKPQDAQIIWNECKHYQKIWKERILSENEIEQHYQQLQSGEIDPLQNYTRFILNNYKIYQQMGRAFLWKKYFTQESPETGNPGGREGRKRNKLESLSK